MHSIEWKKAAGGCGLNLKQDVYAAYVSGVALFAFESAHSQPGAEHFSCIVVGHMTCGAYSLEEVQAEGMARAKQVNPADADRKLTHAEFDALVADEQRLRYIPTGVYVIGCCYRGHKTPYKTVDVPADNLAQALNKGHQLLQPSTVEHVVHVGTRPNPAHIDTLVAAGLLADVR